MRRFVRFLGVDHCQGAKHQRRAFDLSVSDLSSLFDCDISHSRCVVPFALAQEKARARDQA
ncbi:MAG TPA: hypothetical protein VIZ32_07175 [Vicinamibacterales bacterium]